MINLTHFIEANRIKFIHKILNSESEHWNMIGKYWLSSLDKKYASENFLFHCSNIKGLHLPIPSQFYKDAISSWSSFRGKLQTNDSVPILEQQICGNNQILRRNILLWLETISKSGLKTIRNIWDKNGMDFIDENVVVNKLVDKRNGVKYYRLIKSSITEGWVTALKSAPNQENILKNRSNKIQNVLHLERENKMSLKEVQCILKNDAFKSKYQTKWESMFNVSINWKKSMEMLIRNSPH